MDADSAAGLVGEPAAARPGRPLMVAVDGPSAAGTTTLARAAGLLLGAVVVAGDDFYRDLPEGERLMLTAAQGVELYFDHQRLRREALEPLRAGRDARYRPFDWRAGAGLATEEVRLAPTPVIVLDGVYSGRPELADLVDLAVLVDTPAAERRRRLAARGHGNDAWQSRWDAAERLYFAEVRPPSSFDLVVPGA